MTKQVLVATLVTLLFGALVIAATIGSAFTEEPRSAFATEEDRAPLVEEAMAQGLEALRLLSGPSGLMADHQWDPSRTLLVLIAPERPYRAEESEAVRAFLDEGGRLLVADNYGFANTVTSDLGVTFERVQLIEGAPDGIVPTTIAGTDLFLRVSSPTAVHVDPEIDHNVLAVSSTDSFLDRDGDGAINAWDPPGPFPLLVEAGVGELGGRVVAISDPTVLRGEGPDADHDETNAAFLRVLMTDLLPEGGQVIVDESRQSTPDPWLFSAATIGGALASEPWKQIIGAIAVVSLAIAALGAMHQKWGHHIFDIHRFIRRADLDGKDPQPQEETKGAIASGQSMVHWSRRGKAAVGGAAILGVGGIILGNMQATFAAGLLLIVASLAIWTGPPRVQALRSVGASRVHEGTKTRVDIALEAKGGGAVEVEILDELAKEFELATGDNWFRTTLLPKKAVTVTYMVRAGLRGPHTIGPLNVRTSDAFQMRMTETVVADAHRTLVLPRSNPLSRIPFKSKIPLLTLGPHLVNRAGDGTEFHSLRDYQNGDSIRIVNWKASARTKELVVNQRVHESMATITVYLDARAIAGAGTVSQNPLNEGCRAVLSVVSGALQARDKVRVFVYGDGVQELCPLAGRSKMHELADALAGLEAVGHTTFGEAIERTAHELVPNSPLILVSGFEGDTTIIEGLQTVQKRSSIPFVLAMGLGTEPVTDEDQPEPDARNIQQEQKKYISEIQSSGTPVVPSVSGVPLGELIQVGLR